MSDAALVPAGDMAALDRLDPASREMAVTGMLIECEAWLAHAVEATKPRPVAEFRAYIATVEHATKQLGLSKEIQRDATKMVRRAEERLAVTIREGQAAGEIRKSSEGGGPNPLHRVERIAPTNFAKQSELSGSARDKPGIYALTDGVTHEQFETALTEAEAEGNLTRANVVRKLKGGPAVPIIVRNYKGNPAIKALPNSIATLQGVAHGMRNLTADAIAELDEVNRARWARDLTEILTALRRTRDLLKGI